MKDIKGFDLLKFLLALVIVSLHASLDNPFLPAPFSKLIQNFQNLAVPGFFVISSYVFFARITDMSSREQRVALWKYEKRVLILYLSWSVIMLPITLRYHDYLSLSFGLLLFIKDFFFSYTFLASWFFGALIVGVPIVWLVRNKTSVLLALSLLSYSYLSIVKYLPDTIQIPYQWYASNVAAPELSFPRGFVWLGMGCVLAKTRILDRIKMILYAMGGVFLLIIISLLISWLQLLGVISIIVLFYHINVRGKIGDRTVRMRKLSTLIYCVHYPIIHAVWMIIQQEHSFLVFIVATLICIGISEIILTLSFKKKLSFLKYLM